jgi:hypothetical protein
MANSFWDVIGFLIVASMLGSFAFWLIGYFVVETWRYWVGGGGDQQGAIELRVLDTSRSTSPPPSKKAA